MLFFLFVSSFLSGILPLSLSSLTLALFSLLFSSVDINRERQSLPNLCLFLHIQVFFSPQTLPCKSPWAWGTLLNIWTSPFRSTAQCPLHASQKQSIYYKKKKNPSEDWICFLCHINRKERDKLNIKVIEKDPRWLRLTSAWMFPSSSDP